VITLPLRFAHPDRLEGATWEEVAPFYAHQDPVRRIERASIFAFVAAQKSLLRGRVLDFGSGKQPYKSLVDGEYVPFEFGDSVLPRYEFDAVLCTQVAQYADTPFALVEHLHTALKPGGHLVMTYPTNWAEVEVTDLWRFTRHGMTRLLLKAGFEITEHRLRAEVAVGEFRFPLGYGVVAQR
jgi:SAM-dependent methyltransferase